MSFFCISSDEEKSNSFFSGYAFTKNSLVVNHNGYSKYHKEEGDLFDSVDDGRFILFEKKGDFFRLRTDPSGQCIIYYYVDKEFWVVSDSLLELSKKLSSAGKSKKAYQPSVDVFKNERLSLIGGQLVSNNTALSNVKTLGLSESIELSWLRSPCHFLVSKLAKKTSYTDYEEFLYDYVSSWKGRLQAVSNLQQESYLALSGGVDSRAILALWSNSPTAKKINCHSHKKYELEYEIAKKLCVLADQNFGSGMKGLKTSFLSPEESYKLSMAGNASIKTNYGFRKNIVENKQLHFIGGCSVGSFYMKSSYKARAARLGKQFGDAGENVANEILLSLQSLGVDQNNPWAMFHHYYNFRARYHYGNEAYTQFGSIQVQPLLDYRLHQIPGIASKEYVEGNGVVRDIIKVANKSLLNVSFDSPEKVKAKEVGLSEKLSTIKAQEYKCFYGDDDRKLELSGGGYSEAGWHKDLKQILMDKKSLMVDAAVELGFNDAYIQQAVKEIEGFSKSEKLRKSGVLLGLYEIFNS